MKKLNYLPMSGKFSKDICYCASQCTNIYCARNTFNAPKDPYLTMADLSADCQWYIDVDPYSLWAT